MRRTRWVVVWLLACCLAALLWCGQAAAQSAPSLQVFVREGCPRCADAEEYLRALGPRRPGLVVTYRHVDRDRAALADLERRSRQAGVQTPGVPSFAVGEELLVGFESAEVSGPALEALLDGRSVAAAAASAGICVAAADASCPPEPVSDEVPTRLGSLSASRLGLPLFTVVLGLLDGFNPCAMWVLLFLLSMLVNFRDRRRMAIVAGTFVAVSGLVYFAFMAAWLNVFLLLGFSRPLQLVLGLVALGIGALNAKDFFAFKRGPSLSIPESAKPGIYARVRNTLRAPTVGASVAGVAALAVLVNFVELLCTAGLPAVYTAVLARQGLPWWGYFGYLGLYNVAYIADDSLMVGLAVLGLSRYKLSERAGRWLKLVSGVVMLGLAAGLLFWPELLS